MEKVIQEFRIIETDDGFRIEIKGDKEQLREWVMRLDPRHWGGPGPGMRFAFGPHGMRHGRRGHRFGPFGFGAWSWCDEDDEDEAEASKAKRGGEEAV
jgi:hypothetical protein